MNTPALPLLDVRRLARSYDGKRGLTDALFQVFPGEVVGLVGPNGAGKTTLLECLLGLRQPDVSEIYWKGSRVVPGPGVWSGRIGAQLQGESLPASLTVRECLELHGAFSLRSLSPVVLLERGGLAAWAERRVGELSAGLRQRLSVALAFQPAPELVLLDEPTSSLDMESKALLRSWIRQAASEGTAFLISSHDLLEATLLFDRWLVMSSGGIQRMDTRSSGSQLLRPGFLRVETVPDLRPDQLTLLPGLDRVTRDGGGWSLEVADVAAAHTALCRLAEVEGFSWRRLALEAREDGS